MHVEALELNQFRNYRNLNIELDPYLNIFVGDNAQGKTNLLESVYFWQLVAPTEPIEIGT